MRVVLDTNILISGLLYPRRSPGKIISRWLAGSFLLLSHEDQLAEVRRITRRERIRPFITRAAAGDLVNALRSAAVMIGRLPSISRSPDPDDDYLLALAETGQANFLVTGDKTDLLALGRHGSTPIISVHDFAEMLGV